MIPGRYKAGREQSGERQERAGSGEPREEGVSEKKESCQRCQMLERPQGRTRWIQLGGHW